MSHAFNKGVVLTPSTNCTTRDQPFRAQMEERALQLKAQAIQGS
ncbi:hypothetical protein cgp_1472 [Corynebacterium glutamicum MB001]|nr:hypothetical protein cgp_1472 [Corynebacterium glutamicum MB001]ASW13936.1 hypothetical protein cgc1_1472 [Corynebacterium glutamicum]QYO73529.1 hypothetical protein cgisf_1472 [Corynebacterium glutamicum]